MRRCIRRLEQVAATMMWHGPTEEAAALIGTSAGIFKGRIQRVSDREMAAIKAAVESATPGGSDS
jgi:hypothetical protein